MTPRCWTTLLGILCAVGGCASRSALPPDPQPAPLGVSPAVCDAKPSPAERQCTRAEDCTVVPIVTDCCGTVLATGIRAGASAAFAQQTARCDDARGQCECVAEPTRRDDGSNAADELETAADCVSSLCTTRAATAQ